MDIKKVGTVALIGSSFIGLFVFLVKRRVPALPTTFTYLYCGKTFSSQEELNAHYASAHSYLKRV